MGVVQNACSKSVPCAARRSMFGVAIPDCPVHPKVS